MSLSPSSLGESRSSLFSLATPSVVSLIEISCCFVWWCLLWHYKGGRKLEIKRKVNVSLAANVITSLWRVLVAFCCFRVWFRIGFAAVYSLRFAVRVCLQARGSHFQEPWFSTKRHCNYAGDRQEQSSVRLKHLWTLSKFAWNSAMLWWVPRISV